MQVNQKNRTRNQALLRFITLPLIFLTVALLGGLRVAADDKQFIFIGPPLITLVFACLLLALFIRGEMLRVPVWLSQDYPPLANIAHALTLISLFFASAQAFNSVLPERGLFFWLFSFFFLWTLWNNLFSVFDAKQLLRSLIALFGMAFILKHLIVASFSAPQDSWWRKLAGIIFEGLSLDSFVGTPFAPATGYISFFALLLYLLGLFLLPAEPIEEPEPPPQPNKQLMKLKKHEALIDDDDDALTVVSES